MLVIPDPSSLLTKERRLPDADYTRLTPCQRRVVMYLAMGFVPKEIARFAGVSVDTVRDHVKASRERLGISRQVVLLRWAISVGLVHDAPAGAASAGSHASAPG